jgi:hypothetical protein
LSRDFCHSVEEKKNFLTLYIPAEKKKQLTSDMNMQLYRYISLLGLRWISSIQFTRSIQTIAFLSLYGYGVKICYFESYVFGGVCIFVLIVRLIGKGVPIVKGNDNLSSHKFHFNIILPSHSYSKYVLKVFLPNVIMFSLSCHRMSRSSGRLSALFRVLKRHFMV